MRKMKRGLSLVLASIMATALVGCSGGENTETTNTATTTENKETTGTTQAADEKSGGNYSAFCQLADQS